MLAVEKDSRQVPKTQEICASKKYCDIMYSYLQCRSEKINGHRVVSKKDINFTRLGELFGVTRQTASVRFKNLKELGLVKPYGDNFEIITLERNIASLIPYNTLKLLTDTLNENSISVYVYLLNCYYANKCQPFQFTLEQIKEQIGVCTSTRSNDNIITNILYVLSRIGLIRYSLTAAKQENDNFQNVKTIYQLDKLTNIIAMK